MPFVKQLLPSRAGAFAVLLGVFSSSGVAEELHAPFNGGSSVQFTCQRTIIVRGPDAAKVTAAACPESRLVVIEISRVALYRLQEALGVARVTGVYFEFPPKAQLRLLKASVPSAKNVGVLFSKASKEQYLSLHDPAKHLGIDLVPVEVPPGIPPARALHERLSGLDAVLVMADPSILTPSTIKPLLLGAARRYVPLFGGLSPAYVDAGLAGGIFASEASMTAEASQMRDNPGDLPAPTYARRYQIRLNAAVGRLLNIHPVTRLPDEDVGAAYGP